MQPTYTGVENMDNKQAVAVVAIIVIIAGAIYATKGAKDMGIGWKPTTPDGQPVVSSGWTTAPAEPAKTPTCIQYDLQAGTWTCTAIGIAP